MAWYPALSQCLHPLCTSNNSNSVCQTNFAHTQCLDRACVCDGPTYELDHASQSCTAVTNKGMRNSSSIISSPEVEIPDVNTWQIPWMLIALCVIVVLFTGGCCAMMICGRGRAANVINIFNSNSNYGTVSN